MTNRESEICPFNVDDVVVYRPSARGLAADMMSFDSEKLVPGKKYVVSEIRQGRYVLVKGYSHPGGGLFWTEFEPATCSSPRN